MDWKEIYKSLELTQGRKLISKYEFSLDKVKSPVITIYLWEQLNGLFFATTDYSVQNGSQNTPHREKNPHSIADEALRFAIQSITMWIQEPFDSIQFIKEEYV